MVAMNKSELMASSSHLLRTFVTIANCGNITHAADQLDRTQSAISVQTKRLEEILDVRLFTRQSSGMLLTAEGKKLLPDAQRIVSELKRLGALFGDPLQGCVRVGIPDDYADSVLESVLAEFAQRHPHVEVSARFGCTSKFPDAIRKGTLDVAVVSKHNANPDELIASESNVWVASPELKLSAKDTVPLAILDRDCGWRVFASNALDDVGRNWRIAYASENFTGVKAAIRTGLAVGTMPRSLKDPTMIELENKDGFPSLPSTMRGVITAYDPPNDIVAAMVEAIKSATMRKIP